MTKKLEEAKEASALHIKVGAELGPSEFFSALMPWMIAGNREPRPHFGRTLDLSNAMVAAGDPTDVFITDEGWFVDQLVDEGHLDGGTKTAFLNLHLVVAVRKDAAWVPASFEDLAGPKLKELMHPNGNDPAGVAANAALEHAGILEKVGKRITIGVPGERPLAFKEPGTNVAAICYSHQVNQDLKVAFEIPSESHPPLHCWAVVATKATHKKDAQKFVEYLKSPEAAKALQEQGLDPVAAPGP